MKNDAMDGSAKQDPYIRPARRNLFLEGIAKIVAAMKPKRFVSYRKKRTNKDGSSVETEFIYRDDS
jgi:hypothetical protein